MNRLLLIILIIFNGLGSIAQNSELTMTVSKETVAVGERFRLSMTLTDASSPIVPPRLEGFSVLQGPSERSSTQLSNQGFSVTKTLSYIISANTAGSYTIGAAEARTNKGRIRSNTVDLEVVERSTTADPSKGDEQTISVNMPNGYKLMSFVSKKEVVVGEPVLVSYVLYTNENNVQLNEYRNPPQHEGFISKNTTVEEPSWVLSTDRTYKKMHLADQILVPVESGTFDLDPYIATVVKARFFSGNKYKAQSDRIQIKVNPLPAGSGPAFRGAVGALDISASLSSKQVETNAPVHLQLRVSGSGNLETISFPDLDLPTGLESYEPEISDRLTTVGGTIQGSRTFDYLIIPRSPGAHSIPPIEFEYYDTAQKRYVKRSTNELKFVAQGTAGSATIERPGQSHPDEPEVVGTPNDDGAASDIFSGRTVLLTLGTGLFAFLLFIGFRKFKSNSKEKADRKAKQADQLAERILKEARAQKDAGNTSAFYSSLYQAMNRYVEQKLLIPTADMNRKRVSSELAKRSVDEQTRSSWERVLDQCEMAAYSQVGVADPESLYKEVSELIKTLEGQV